MNEHVETKAEGQNAATNSSDEANVVARPSYESPSVDSISTSERLSLLGSHGGSCHPAETQVGGACVQT